MTCAACGAVWSLVLSEDAHHPIYDGWAVSVYWTAVVLRGKVNRLTGLRET